MKRLNIFTTVIFCSLLAFSANSLADRRHADRVHDSDRHTKQSDHQYHPHKGYSIRRNSHAYTHNQNRYRQKHHNKHNYQSYRHYSNYGQRVKRDRHHYYVQPRHVSYYQHPQPRYSSIRRSNYYNPGLNVYLKF